MRLENLKENMSQRYSATVKSPAYGEETQLAILS